MVSCKFFLPFVIHILEKIEKSADVEWMIRFGSASVFGLGLPFLAQVLLEKFGHAMTLRIYGVGIVSSST